MRIRTAIPVTSSTGWPAPIVIIADYRLRDHQTGIAAIELLRERFGSSLPALLVSGDTTEELFRAARERSLIFIAKPISSARLRAALLHFLSKHGGTGMAKSGNAAT